MRRALPCAVLLFLALLLVPGRAEALTVVGPGADGPLLFGESVVIQGKDKAADTQIKFWDGDNYVGCFPQPSFESSGDWECSMFGPFAPGSYPFELHVFDVNGDRIGPWLPIGFEVISVFSVDDASLVLDARDPIRVTGKADPVAEVKAAITRASDPSYRLELECALPGDGTFRCEEPSRTAARMAALPVADDYQITVSEIDSEIGQIAQIQKAFSVTPAQTPGPTPGPTPTPIPELNNPGATPSPSSEPRPTPQGEQPLVPIPQAGPTLQSTPLPVPEGLSPQELPPNALTPTVPPTLLPTPPLAPDLSLLVGLLIVAFTTLTIAGGRSFSRLRLVGLPGAESRFRLPMITDAGAEESDLDRDAEHRQVAGWGDRSWTWRLPGHLAADRVSRIQPSRVAPWSPLVGRLGADAGYLRSILGIASFGPLLAAVAVAAAALGQTDGRPLPPSWGLIVAVIVLASLDAMAGAAAVALFALGTVLSGGLTDPATPSLAGSLAVLVVLGLLWSALPVIGSATRPFRRRSNQSAEPEGRYSWDRIADVLIAAPLCGWIAYKLTQALSPFAGLDLAVSERADVVGFATAGGILLRFILEEVAEHGYPLRLRQVETPGSLPEPSRLTNLGGALVRSLILLLLAYVFLGNCWQLWVGIVLVGGLQVAAVFEDKLPKSPRLGLVLPRGITEMLVMLVICSAVASWATVGERVGIEQLRDCFVIMAVPAAVLSGLNLFATSPEPRPWNWPQQLAGVAVYVGFVALVLAGW